MNNLGRLLGFSASRLLGFSAAVLLSGCVTPLTSQTTAKKHGIPNLAIVNPVYANLVADERDGYRFAGLDAGSGEFKLGGMEVRSVGGEKDCGRGVFGLLPTYCAGDFNPKLESARPGWSNAIVLVFWPISWPLCLGAPFSSDLADLCFPVLVDVNPDQKKYDRALLSARRQSQHDARWPVLQKRYDNLVALAQGANGAAESLRLSRAGEQVNAAASYANEWHGRVLDLVQRQSQVTVRNVSGWPEGDIGSRAGGLVTRSLGRQDWVPNALPEPSLQVGVVPARDLDDFERKLGDEERRIPEQVAAYRREMEMVVAEREASLDSFRKELEQNNARVTVAYSDLERAMDRLDWQYEANIESEARLENGKLVTPPCVCVTLKAKRFEHVIPPVFRVSDKALDVQYKNRTVTIRNNTRNYVTVDALTVYYSRDANTKGGANFQNYQEIPPGEAAEVYVGDQISSYDSSYTVSRAEAAKTNIRFGLAVKYRMTHDSTPRSLFQTKDYSLLSLIEG